MRILHVQAMAAPLACSLFAASPGAKAAELQPLTPLYALGLPTDASSANDSYRPFLFESYPGDTLRIDVVNQLSPDAAHSGDVNLHTHGLVASPRPCIPLGDDVFIADQPDTTVSYRFDIPATLPGTMVGNQPSPVRYPSGLQWFHARLHEATSDDVTAGQAGMFYVGDLRADLPAAPGIDAASAAALGNADTVYMGLRDIQLAVPRGAVPDQGPPGQAAQWLRGADHNPNAQAITNVDAYHDTFPLPPYGGRIFITAPFFAPQQVGNFVYHCHILSHEDGGMMAVMQVYDPTQLASAEPNGFGTLASVPICGLRPPAPRAASFSERVRDAIWSAALQRAGPAWLLGKADRAGGTG